MLIPLLGKTTVTVLNRLQDVKERKDADAHCEKHDEPFREVRYDTYRCPSCEEEVRQEALQRAKAEDARRQLRLPPRLQRYTFEAYRAHTKEQKEVLSVCRAYAAKYPTVGGILMLGGVGTGKTHLAVSICKELADRGISARMATVTKIIRDVRSTWSKGSEENEAEVIRKYVALGLLVIDEIGSQYGSEGERVIVNEIINDRYEAGVPTALIGNVSLREAKEILGERVVDRVVDNGHILIFDWESARTSIKEEK
jgi:DNA replication protein DnaC